MWKPILFNNHFQNLLAGTTGIDQSEAMLVIRVNLYEFRHGFYSVISWRYRLSYTFVHCKTFSKCSLHNFVFRCCSKRCNMLHHIRFLTHWSPEKKMPPFSKRYFQMHFPEWKCLTVDYNFTDGKPLSEPMMAYFTDAYMCHSASIHVKVIHYLYHS